MKLSNFVFLRYFCLNYTDILPFKVAFLCMTALTTTPTPTPSCKSGWKEHQVIILLFRLYFCEVVLQKPLTVQCSGH